MLDLSKPYTTRDGRKAFAAPGPDGRLYGWCEQGGGNYDAESWEADGQYFPAHGDEAKPWDLINVPVTRTIKVWTNIIEYQNDHGRPQLWTFNYDSRVEADRNGNASDGKRIACIEREITFTEGEGL